MFNSVTNDGNVHQKSVNMYKRNWEEFTESYTEIRRPKILEDFWIEYNGQIYDMVSFSEPELSDISFCETNEGEGSSNSSNNLDYSLRPDDYLPDIVTFGKRIINSSSDSMSLFTEAFINAIPKMDYFNLMPFYMFQVRLNIAQGHYEQNVQAIENLNAAKKSEIFDSFIVDQTEEIFDELHWGIFSAPISETGCEIISVYNALKEANSPVDFASLIFLFEMCNADFFGGILGVLPIDKDYLTTMIADVLNLPIHTTLFKILDDILESLRDLIEKILENPITIFLTGGGSVIIDKTFVQPFFDGLKILFGGIIGLASVLAEHILSSVSSIGDMVRIVFGNKSITEFVPLEWNSFISTLSKRKRCIVSYSLEYNPLTDSPNIFGKVHTIYITKVYLNRQYYFYAYNNLRTIDYYFTKDEFLAFFEFSEDDCSILGEKKQFLWGGVFND